MNDLGYHFYVQTFLNSFYIVTVLWGKNLLIVYILYILAYFLLLCRRVYIILIYKY